uniref:Uncharacterized protein n=1 Tax=Physcomitrium patens TaxID=3218 RepID=A0A2K1K9Z6_PHYPA|nr:hypothetical protein PHYPA_009784 [Physcomitrium patens]
MATTSLCDDLPPSLEKEDIVLQGLKESQSELLSHVKKLKEDWQADMDRQMNSCEQVAAQLPTAWFISGHEIEGLSNAHNAEMERLQIGCKQELLSRANALKEQLWTLQQNWQLEVGALAGPPSLSAKP